MPSSGNPLSIEDPYRTIAEVIHSLSALQQMFLSRRDRRAVFVTAYLQVTEELEQRIAAKFFHDSDWVTRLLINFSNLYRKALAAYENNAISALPESWKIALSTSAGGKGLVIQDLLLGMNAHINRDLAFALVEVGLDPQRNLRHEDHAGVNKVLQELTDKIQDRIADMYAPGLASLDLAAGRLDELFTSFKLQAAREHAWDMGVALADSKTSAKRTLVSAAIEKQAAAVARLILTPAGLLPELLQTLREVEQNEPWWEWLKEIKK